MPCSCGNAGTDGLTSGVSYAVRQPFHRPERMPVLSLHAHAHERLCRPSTPTIEDRGPLLAGRRYSYQQVNGDVAESHTYRVL